jgi:hypothetical protein
MLSVIAEYVGMIYTETRSRPTFIIKRDRLWTVASGLPDQVS